MYHSFILIYIANKVWVSSSVSCRLDTVTQCPCHSLSWEAPLGGRTPLQASSTTGDACSASRHCGIDGRVWPQGRSGSGTDSHPLLLHPSATAHLKWKTRVIVNWWFSVSTIIFRCSIIFSVVHDLLYKDF